jgi:uncharacterized protein (TIGR00251 family)
VIAIQETTAGATFAIKLQARSRRDAIVGQLGEALKITLTAPPVNGRANEACIAFFADRLRVPRCSVSIVSGWSSRRKIIRVAGVSAQEIRKRLGI